MEKFLTAVSDVVRDREGQKSVNYNNADYTGAEGEKEKPLEYRACYQRFLRALTHGLQIYNRGPIR